MLTPEQLDMLPDSFDSLFQELDEFIVKDYARRVAKAGKVTDTAEWIAERAEMIGLSEEEIQKETARILKMSQQEIEEVFEDAAITSAEADASRFASAGLSAERIATSAFLQSYISAAVKQTQGEMENITRTIGTATADGIEDLTDYYRRTLDELQLRVSTGVSDYNSATRQAVKRMAARGVQTVDYTGRCMNLQSAARMCILTGVNQMSRHMNDAICDELDLDLVEVTAHAGARPSHQVWQGNIYSRSGRKKGYEDLYEATGLGNADGLCGANCRHNYYGYYEGSPRTWTKEELENIDPEPFEYNGKEYTYYEASQRMRYMERQIRKTKREAVGFEAAGLDEDFTSASIKLNRQKQEYQKFARASGVRPRLERTQEFGYNRSVSSKAAWRVRKTDSGMDLMSNSFRPRLGNARGLTIDSVKVTARPVTNSQFDMVAEVGYGRRSKAVRLVEKRLQEVSKSLPEGFQMPKIAIVDFEKHNLAGDQDAIGGYLQKTNTFYYNGKYDSGKKILEYLKRNKGRFANTTADAPFLHELGHKYYYDRINIIASTKNISYIEAKKIVDDTIDNAVSKTLATTESGILKKELSEYASKGYFSGKYTEVYAESFSAINHNDIAGNVFREVEAII